MCYFCLPDRIIHPTEQREWVPQLSWIFLPELTKGVMRTSLSVLREWADVHPEKANHVPTLGQHFWRPYQQGKGNADHCEGQKCGPNIRNYCRALLPGREMQKEQRKDRNMGKYLSWELYLTSMYHEVVSTRLAKD